MKIEAFTFPHYNGSKNVIDFLEEVKQMCSILDVDRPGRSYHWKETNTQIMEYGIGMYICNPNDNFEPFNSYTSFCWYLNARRLSSCSLSLSLKSVSAYPFPLVISFRYINGAFRKIKRNMPFSVAKQKVGSNRKEKKGEKIPVSILSSHYIYIAANENHTLWDVFKRIERLKESSHGGRYFHFIQMAQATRTRVRVKVYFSILRHWFSQCILCVYRSWNHKWHSLGTLSLYAKSYSLPISYLFVSFNI